MAELPASFGKYFLCDKIAAGGMAEIYLAKLLGPDGFEKQLVIKQISPELSKERAFVELFVAEAKTLVSLSHGNIVPVYELGVVDDTYFIAMEYVDGPTLGQLMTALERRGERLAPGVAAHVAGELSKGLDYAHRKGDGVVHRDLSPRNVLLSRDGEVKLVDFGLALPSDRARRAHRSGEEEALLPAGSFPYMSPEQVRLEALDARSDVFSLGVLLWEMLAGRRLFAREGVDETLSAVLGEPILRPSEVQDGVPAELDRVCARALARPREERYQAAGEVLSALARFAYSVDPPVTQATLAQLVARVCPPSVKDLESEPVATEPGGARLEPEQTRPMERPSGRRRAATACTFATSETFDQVLANATPLMPFPAMTDSAARALARVAPRAAAPVPARRGRRWVALAVGVAVAAVAAAMLWGREPAPRQVAAAPGAESGEVRGGEPRIADPGIAHPGPEPTADPPAALIPVASADSPPADPGATDAPSDPHLPDRRSAVVERRPKGQGTLHVGANPWADVFVDGALVGQAPGAFPVAAGPHAVELRYRERRRTFKVNVDPGETERLGLVDFTAP